ncbi:uncharacterized protein LOC123542376 [Mercenaria mercenaria]|uniref:uncharacterized protein LOC123542376 n=1 Tax=Mercenaria mercenaria TaxID=6596 RepID=UPI00234F5629|nr:uncharacterized protein LOC123542376 [Mercenaria mercenaria]
MADDVGNFQKTESKSKRQKTEEKDIFSNFANKEKECRNLIRVVTDLISGSGIEPLIVCPLKITGANANLTRSFRSAVCLTEYYMKINDPTKPFTINIGSLFESGCAVLMEFFENKRVPKHEESRRALKRLIEFLTINDFSGLFDWNEKENEAEWCVRLAQHLFAPLSTSESYIVDNSYEESGLSTCPCSSKDEFRGTFGDTSFGCRNLWHGKVDILFEAVPVVVSHCADSSDNESESSEAEASPDQLTTLEMKFHMRAQAIVFGFYQNRHHSGKLLVPSIGISKEKIVFRFYDSVNDVLLETRALDLCSYEKNLSLHAVVLIWLTLNYRYFLSDTPESLEPYTSQFHRVFQSYIPTYRSNVMAPCHAMPLPTEKRLPKVPGEDIIDVEAVKQAITFKSIYDL